MVLKNSTQERRENMLHIISAAAGLAAFSFLCNVPLGRWRASLKRFSVFWYLAVHLSIPIVLLLRLKMGLSAWFIPLSLGTAIAGQLVGGLLGSKKNKGTGTQF
jgi:hypothetical protein